MTVAGSPAHSLARPEIQALRAVAIGAVLGYHFLPRAVPAGFVGVDVFFVVSGYLITGLLLRDADRSGRVRLGRFYLRRFRRIMPAAFATLAAVAVATLAFVPRMEWRVVLEQTLASALYVQNWYLAVESQNPALSALDSTPVQHFWSLSVEEQFYLVWPLLIIVAGVIARTRRATRRVVALILSCATAGSFTYCVWLTSVDHNLAYFSTVSRAWEFGVGGLLALAPAIGIERLARVRAATGWIGLGAIVLSCLTFTDPQAFPGYIALLPVVGTASIIWAGMPAVPWSLALLAKLRAVQWVGDISYSLYLWHWPIILFTPYITGEPSGPAVMVLLLGVTLVVSAASKRWIEDPFRPERG